ncbi:GNAT family N-acetyltransferase [Solicola gregarius]|uniref:GNAT family N-acetyltransferase n=1 Tax=Solicola gregarius TaxID=2908642 RepID=A0AA46TGP4_9ACTN|nr:GNAT family N-acetyltransferase [Solicola gregarius]UYM04504.1 GNAT family N-acetyltransferase [Solicola gregarius]
MSSPTADVSVRVAWADDAPAIARCQVAAWRELYAGLLPQEIIDSLDADEFARKWSASMDKPGDARNRVLVALERAAVRGFAVTAPSSDPDADPIADGEVAEFIVDGAARRQGHGSRLLQACTDTLRADRFTRATWWVASTNDDLRTFVEGTGWAPDGAHRELDLDGSGATTVKQIRLHTSLVADDD